MKQSETNTNHSTQYRPTDTVLHDKGHKGTQTLNRQDTQLDTGETNYGGTKKHNKAGSKDTHDTRRGWNTKQNRKHLTTKNLDNLEMNFVGSNLFQNYYCYCLHMIKHLQ